MSTCSSLCDELVKRRKETNQADSPIYRVRERNPFDRHLPTCPPSIFSKCLDARSSFGCLSLSLLQALHQFRECLPRLSPSRTVTIKLGFRELHPHIHIVLNKTQGTNTVTERITNRRNYPAAEFKAYLPVFIILILSGCIIPPG